MNIINEFMSYEERQQLVTDIKKYYPGGSRWATIISNMPDHQLLAFRQSLTNTKRLNGNMNREIGIHINVIMNLFWAKDYIIEDSNNTYMVYIGRYLHKNDVFGNSINIQYGYIKINNNYNIIEVEMLGKKHKRFNGMRLNFNWNSFS